MNVAVISDIQLHAYAAFSRVLPSGRNSRLQHGIDAINFAVDEAKGGHLVLLGDIFEDRRSLTLDVLDAAIEAVAAASRKLKGITVVVGNHDQFFRDGSIHSLRALGEMRNVRVVSSFHSEKIDGRDWHFAAYHHDVQTVRDWIKTLPAGGVLCLHQAMLGAEADGGFIYENANALDLDDVRDGDFVPTLVGHFHKPQSLSRNVHYVGSPYQIKVSEQGEIKRIAVVEGKNLFWVPVPCCPTFRRISADEFSVLPQSEKDAFFWEIEGVVPDVPANARLRAEPRAPITYSTACADADSAVTEWLGGRERPDLAQQALAYLT